MVWLIVIGVWLILAEVNYQENRRAGYCKRGRFGGFDYDI